MIIAVASVKGAPGATTFATVLGMRWPGERVVAEFDPRGADLPFRPHRVDGQPMSKAPSIATLAVDARPGAVAPAVDRHAQATILGVPVIPGVVPSPAFATRTHDGSGQRSAQTLARHMPAVADACAAWAGTVLADVGELRPGSAAMPVARAAEAVLLLVRPTLEGLGRLWERAEELAEVLGDPTSPATKLGVVVLTPQGEAKASLKRAETVLASVGSPVPVVAPLALDPKTAAKLWSGRPDHRLGKTPLVRSVDAVISRVFEQWPGVLNEIAWAPPDTRQHGQLNQHEAAEPRRMSFVDRHPSAAVRGAP